MCKTRKKNTAKVPPLIHMNKQRLDRTHLRHCPVLPSDWSGSLLRAGGWSDTPTGRWRSRGSGCSRTPQLPEDTNAHRRDEADGDHDGAECKPTDSAGRREEEQPRSCKTPGEGFSVSQRQGRRDWAVSWFTCTLVTTVGTSWHDMLAGIQSSDQSIKHCGVSFRAILIRFVKCLI